MPTSVRSPVLRLIRYTTTCVAAAALLVCPADAQGTPEDGDRAILVLAAASLADELPRVAEAWMEAGGTRARFSFAATSRLASQALERAPADVFISADRRWMEVLLERGVVDSSSVTEFLGNRLVLVVPRGRELPSSPERLAGSVGRLALAGEAVPAGRYAREALEAAGVWNDLEARVVRGGSVRGALEWVSRGEVDAGVVYATDARAQPAVEVAFIFADSTHAPIRYSAAVLSGSPQPDVASAFLDFVAGPVAAGIFTAAGFTVVGPDVPVSPDRAPATGVLSIASAIRISLIVAALATLAGLPLAVGLGFLLARRDFAGKAVVTTVTLAPLVMPPVVTGFLLLSLLGSEAPLGRILASMGVTVPFTLLGAVIAALVVGFPLYVLSIRNAFEAVDAHYEALSWTLGVPPRRTFLRVSLPLAMPGIAAGALLAFARSLGEFGATIVIAGNVEGDTRTIALAVYTLLESPGGRAATWTLVGASIVLSMGALIGYETLARRQKRRLEAHHGR